MGKSAAAANQHPELQTGATRRTPWRRHQSKRNFASGTCGGFSVVVATSKRSPTPTSRGHGGAHNSRALVSLG